jgi:pyrrolysine biosynthesis protein PylD
MTRLLPTDISDLGLNWSGFDSELLELTGLPLLDLAAGALGLSSGQAKALLAGKLTAVVPDTSGDGLIEGFSQALLRISEHLGTKAVIAAPDAQGLAQARSMGADFVLTSSDDEFLCRNLGTGATAENGQATGLGFAQALVHMYGNLLDGQTVGVI